MTPPLDEEEENEESRLFEVQARKDLEKEGCPPCYPSDLEIPLRNPPEKYQPIIGYWQSFPGTGDVVLRTQLSDWQKFRVSQSAARRGVPKKSFSQYVDEVCKRRERHEVGGNIRLRSDMAQQSRLEHWIEFQNYHLRKLERFEKMRDKREKELDNAWRKAGAMDNAFSKCLPDDAKTLRQLLKVDNRDLERHKVLLLWIEQQRQAMDPGYSAPIKEDDGMHTALTSVQKTPTRDRRTKRSEGSAVLGKIRVSKVKSIKHHRRARKSKPPELEGVVQDPGAVVQNSIPQASKLRGAKSRRTRNETPLRQFRPQRVSKTQRVASTDTKSLSRRQSRSASWTRFPDHVRSTGSPAVQKSKPESENVKTQSGRLSIPPVRWTPE